MIDYKTIKTEYKEDAENCLIIYNKLGRNVCWICFGSNWTPLVNTIFKGFPSDERRFKPTEIGKIFLNGLNNTK
jgi:hypothetical protein